MFGYFGSKKVLAPTYQPPFHDVIVEPFAGAAAYSMHWLMRRKGLRAVLVERDPLVVETWQRVLAMTPAEVMALPDVEKGENGGDPLVQWCTSAPGQVAAVASGNCTVTEWMARDWPRERARIASTLAAIGDTSRISVVEGDYTDAPDIDACWFIDPPYVKGGHLYRHGSDGIDYQALGEWCQIRRGDVTVCEQEPADWMDFEPHKTSVDQLGRRYVELVWYSNPPLSLFGCLHDETG